MPLRFMACACVFPPDHLQASHGGATRSPTKMMRELKPELDPLIGPERLTLFCVASRLDPAIAGLPRGIAELLVMKNLARRDRARLSLTDQGQDALHTL